MNKVLEVAKKAKIATRSLLALDSSYKKELLEEISKDILIKKDGILEANRLDVHNAIENNLPSPLIERLKLDQQSLEIISNDILNVADQNDSIGLTIEKRKLKNGLELSKKIIPIGVIGVIYESRPNVTIDIASLCLKTNNVCILRGGKETINTNLYLVNIIKNVLRKFNLSEDIVQYIGDTSRDSIKELLQMDDYVDLIIPRGGSQLHELCKTISKIPVIIGGFGVSHLFVDRTANIEKAINVIIDSKTDKPSACNSLDTLIIHKDIMEDVFIKLAPEINKYKLNAYCDDSTRKILLTKGVNSNLIFKMTEETLNTEWLSLSLNVLTLESTEEVVSHILNHNAIHSDSILTEDIDNANYFIDHIDSAAVYVNCSTRFTDGAAFGLGAEVAVSTQKIHARGPMAIDSLTSYKWVGKGNYLCKSNK